MGTLCKIIGLLLVIFGLVGWQKPEKVDSCGFRGNLHDCHCADRTSAIMHKIQDSCKNEKDRDACLKLAINELPLPGMHMGPHCRIAERLTHWDDFQDGDLEGNNVESSLGSFCKMACKPHRCACTEESCDFK